MASRIITKKGSGAPLASDLVHGELAVDTVNKRLYTENAGGTVIEVGTAPSTIDINAGTIDGTVIGGSSAAAGSFTTFTSTGIDDNATSTAITIDASENVGIGTDSPSTYSGALVVADGTAGGTTHVTVTNNNANQFLKLGVSGDLAQIGYDDGDGIAFGQFTNSTGTSFSSERMRIDNAGNVGIGTTSPSAKIHTVDLSGASGNTLPSNASAIFEAAANMGIAVSAPTAAAAGVYFPRATDAYYAGVERSDTNLLLRNNGTERMRIDNSGNVGIGTSSPVNDSGYASLTISDTTGGQIVFQQAGTTTAGVYGNGSKLDLTAAGARHMQFNTNGSERMRIDSSGNLLVGTTTSLTNAAMAAGGTGFEATDSGLIRNSRNNGTVNIWNRNGTDGTLSSFFKDGVEVGSISVTASSTAYNTSSDERLKENITDAPAGNVDDIKVRSFDWKADGSHQEYGMVAQELEAVAPYAVTKGETEDDMWSVDYSKLVPMLIKEIQDLKAEVAALKGA